VVSADSGTREIAASTVASQLSSATQMIAFMRLTLPRPRTLAVVVSTIQATADMVALAAMLVVAVAHTGPRIEAAVSVGAAGIVLLAGGLDWPAARHEIGNLLPVVGFLVAVLLLGEACRAEGLFDYLGGLLAATAAGNAQRLLMATFLVAAIVTAVLSLDATVVLLTPVVLQASRGSVLRSRPGVAATAHLANSASTLLPVSNLTNLLALSASGASFLGFAGLMAPVWLTTIVVEYVVMRVYFRDDLARRGRTVRGDSTLPRGAFGVVAATLAAFVVVSLVHVEEVWAATVGAFVLATYSLRQRRLSIREGRRSLNLTFALYVICLGLVVTALASAGLASLLRHVVPGSTGLCDLLAVAALGTLAANLVNNLPATLLLLPLVTPVGTVAVLALLIGVNVGSNLTYVGSLANLLWRRALSRDGHRPGGLDFHLLGLATTVPGVVCGVTVLWAWHRLIG
jgi:arsenical pump membrane protein